MTWRQSHGLKLLCLLWLPAACFGQDIGGSRIDSNPLNVYSPRYGKDVSAKAIVLNGEVSPPSSALELLPVLNSATDSKRSAVSSQLGKLNCRSASS
jgi:hypothetical protein